MEAREVDIYYQMRIDSLIDRLRGLKGIDNAFAIASLEEIKQGDYQLVSIWVNTDDFVTNEDFQKFRKRISLMEEL